MWIKIKQNTKCHKVAILAYITGLVNIDENIHIPMVLLIRHSQLQLVLSFKTFPTIVFIVWNEAQISNYIILGFTSEFHEHFFSLENTPYLLNSIGDNILKTRVDCWWEFLLHFSISNFFWISLRLLLAGGMTGRLEGRIWRYLHPLWRPWTRLCPFPRRRCWRRSLEGSNWFCPFRVVGRVVWFSDLESSFFRNERFCLGSVDPGRFLNRWLREIRVLLSH